MFDMSLRVINKITAASPRDQWINVGEKADNERPISGP